ncbi:hypothetical protein OG234_13485 [Streptomyces sp. NBC_01420]|uniref:hypothetical protein n=1 Tax=Streptomyces sp. NBC_01420 TaxID=2903858 RepID=UPI00324474CB
MTDDQDGPPCIPDHSVPVFCPGCSSPDTSGQPRPMSGGHVPASRDTPRTRRPLIAVTSPDTDRTRPDTDTPDTTDTRPGGVRVEYRARVPRRLLGAAVADAFNAIHQATADDIPLRLRLHDPDDAA